MLPIKLQQMLPNFHWIAKRPESKWNRMFGRNLASTELWPISNVNEYNRLGRQFIIFAAV